MMRTWLLAVPAVLVLAMPPAPALAGGGPQNVLLIVDPASPNALHVANHYRHARGIPDGNVIYMDPRADSYAEHTEFQLDALFGMLANLGIADHIDYVIIPPGGSFFVPAAGYVSDGCSPVKRFSISSVYTMAFIADDILSGTASTLRNHYYQPNHIAKAFDSEFTWYHGSQSSYSGARRYFIGALLGYDGDLGNTIEETLAMIDRSVAVDGTRPAGTFYFMETTDELRSGPRDQEFDAAVAAIMADGGSAVHMCCDPLPDDKHDCLGVMTGWASPDIDGTDMTILPGAFCDHLTSYAGTLDSASQTKLSRWIAKGASGSHGTVEEPCNYPGKFPDPRMHAFYFEGASLGEAVLRSLEYVPFQGLIYGDPLTRPFAWLPEVDVPDAPAGVVSGLLTLTPEATTDHPSGDIAVLELYVDGLWQAAIADGDSFTVDTTTWPDGAHDVRVVACDDTLVASQGSWRGTIETDNFGRSASLFVDPASGDLTTPLEFDVSAAGGTVVEIRLVSAGRVVAATPLGSDFVTLLGKDLGAGPARVQAVAEFDDGLLAYSDVILVDLAPAEGPPLPGGETPLAFSYTRHVPLNEPIIVELPATDPEGDALSWSLETLPAQGTIEGSGPTRLFRPIRQASGTDTLTFTVSDGSSTSEVATVTLRFAHVLGDLDDDKQVDLRDFATFGLCFAGPGEPPADTCPEGVDADFDMDDDVDLDDHLLFVDALTGP